jgi:hypothetical protein
MKPTFAWADESLKRLPKNNFMYFLFCLFTLRPRRKMTYKEMFLIISEVNRKSLGQKKANDLAFRRIMDFYKYNHGCLPEGIE